MKNDEELVELIAALREQFPKAFSTPVESTESWKSELSQVLEEELESRRRSWFLNRLVHLNSLSLERFIFLLKEDVGSRLENPNGTASKKRGRPAKAIS